MPGILKGRLRIPRKRGAPVGTEAVALKNVNKNSRIFSYPSDGFVTSIEYTLLYAMISEPTLYPENIVKKMIYEEDFTVYLPVNVQGGNNSKKEEKISYAQLSAILALSAEKWPSSSEDKENVDGQSVSNENTVPQILCKALLQCVVNFAEGNNLDREGEVRSLLRPVERIVEIRGARGALKAIVPFYVGYAASMLTLNPLPMLVGLSVTTAMNDGGIKERQERLNLRSLRSETERRADVEKTSLLDETEHD